MKRLITAALLATVASAGAASATTWQYSMENVNGVDATFKYNDENSIFSLDFANLESANVDGAWWVINDGPMPQSGTRDRYAIFYTDMNDVWAYQYRVRGFSRPGTDNGPLLERWENVVSKTTEGGKDMFSLTLDLTNLQSLDVDPNWVGLAFDDMIGTWLHPTTSTFDECVGSYIGADGGLDCFDGSKWKGWDVANRETMAVPLPATLPMLAAPLVALGFGGLRRKMKSKA